MHFLLSGALTRAVKWGWITTGNPASTAEPPPEPNPDPQPPTPEEAARIVNEAWKDPEWGTLVWLAMTTGARRAELCALRWKHVSLSLGTISVRRSVDQNGAETAEKGTKTHQHRRIALDPDTIAVLTEHRQRWKTRVASLGLSLSDEAFVFSLTPDGSKSMKPNTVTQRYGRLAARLGIATTIHKLRHFSATELIAAGVDPRTVGGRLGHAGGGSTTLRVYSAWVAESDQRAANMLATRMPSRPVAVDRIERAKTQPEAPYEKIAAGIRKQILDGALAPRSPASTQKEIRETHDVSAGTANRVVELLKEWKLVEASRGRRAVVLRPPAEEVQKPEPVTEPTSPASDGEGAELLDLRLFCLGENVRTFTAEAAPGDPAQLRRLLTNAARRHGGKDVDPADYELEVRRAGAAELITTFAAL
ncbi:tyrosine-type recombinase/integrase [Amycolatopsis taiwanensis]|uniref:tyrosine-type recombinase/integrase n=1 Tax=Amycolatopsis taiwanensis TaxID=342230 RepID=UPI00146FB287|nr:tyrosine-type recombinase/integrase [Amycolatopsis taiwanensis]